MACKHRFYDELIPNWEIEYLFIGTFNPEWDKPDGNNAKYFYGRHTNDFWYILPAAFGDPVLMRKELRNNKDLLIEYLQKKKIGLTDLIAEVENADDQNEIHRNDILGMKDVKLGNYHLRFNEISPLLNPSLKGVFFTRQIDEKSVICQEWIKIKKRCQELTIKADELVTPSRGYRSNGYTRERKIDEWKGKIF